MIGIGDQLLSRQRFLAGQNADVGHANDGKPVPAFRAQRASGPIHADSWRSFSRSEVSSEQPIGDYRSALRGHAFFIESERPKPGTMLLAGIGNNVNQIAAVSQGAEFV